MRHSRRNADLGNAVEAARAKETSKYELGMEAMPLLVSTVVGNHTASAIRKALAETAVGKAMSTSGIHAVDGIGPSTRTSGCTQ